MNLIEEAGKIQNGKACQADIELLASVVGKLGDSPCVVMLGAGEIMTMVTFGVRPNALLYTVDNREEAHNWEKKGLENCGAKNLNLVQVLGNSVEVAKSYKGPKINLLIIDSDHTDEGVSGDLQAWASHLVKDHIIFCHDYDAKTAPYFYAGVKKACDKYFDRGPDIREGWSAVFLAEKPVEKVIKPAKKVTKKLTTKKGAKK